MRTSCTENSGKWNRSPRVLIMCLTMLQIMWRVFRGHYIVTVSSVRLKFLVLYISGFSTMVVEVDSSQGMSNCYDEFIRIVLPTRATCPVVCKPSSFFSSVSNTPSHICGSSFSPHTTSNISCTYTWEHAYFHVTSEASQVLQPC